MAEMKTADDIAAMEADAERELLGGEEVVETKTDDIEYVGPDKIDADIEGETDDGRPAKKKAKAEAKPEEKPETKPENERQVNYGALAAERAERRKAEQRIAEIEKASAEKNARLEEKLNYLAQAMQQARQQPEAPAPAWEEDPYAYTEGKLSAADQRIQALEREREQERQWQAQQYKQREEQNQQQARWQQAYQAVNTDWLEAVKERPELNDAYATLQNSYGQELQALGYQGREIQNQLEQIESRIIWDAYAQGRPIAEVVRGLAQARGWNGEKSQQQETQGDEGALNAGKEKLDRLAKAQGAAESLSGTGGASPGGNRMSLESLDRMSPKEIQDWVRRTTASDPEGHDRALAKMMGV